MDLGWAAAGAMVGVPIGTALRSVIFRMSVPSGLRDRTACPHCGTAVTGLPANRCGQCRGRLATPVLPELATAAVLALLFGRFGGQADMLAFGFLGALGVALSAIDIAVHRLPDRLTLPAYPVLVTLLAVPAVIGHDGDALARALLGGVALALGYLLLAMLSPGQLGAGDVKLAGLAGLALGWLGWPTLALGAALGFVLCAVVSLALLAARRISLRSDICFGPFLLAGAMLAMLASGGRLSGLRIPATEKQPGANDNHPFRQAGLAAHGITRTNLGGTVMSIRLAIVESHTLVRYGLRELIAQHPDIEIVAECALMAEAPRKLGCAHPDVVTVDVSLPDGDGLGLARELRDRRADVGIVILTSRDEDDILFRALETGVSAFVAKTAPVEEVLGAIRHSAVAASSFTAARLANAISRRQVAAERLALSSRELEVLRLLRDGLSIPAIALQMYVSYSTARTYVARLYQKLGAANRTQALMTAVRYGLISCEADGSVSSGATTQAHEPSAGPARCHREKNAHEAAAALGPRGSETSTPPLLT